MKVVGVLIVVLAIVIGVVPAFTDCESQGKMITLANGKQISMKCHWTGRSELALALPLSAVGIVMVARRKKETGIGLGALGGILGLGVMALPTALIGVCSGDMPCRLVMKPTLLLSGGLAVGASLVGLVISARSKDPLA